MTSYLKDYATINMLTFSDSPGHLEDERSCKATERMVLAFISVLLAVQPVRVETKKKDFLNLRILRIILTSNKYKNIWE